MTFWVPSPKRWLTAGLALVGLGAVATPATALPIVDVGANAGVALHYTDALAADVTADVNLRGLVISGQYWTKLNAPTNYMQGTIRYNVSPVPMLSVAPGVGLVGGAVGVGPLANVTATFAPILLPASVEAMAGAAYVNNSTLFPYYAGVKFSLIPFTAFALRYRGWGGANGALLGNGGPEIGFEIGL
jgi:hypothetical protein